MSHRAARGAKGFLGAVMGIIMVGVLAVGGLVGFRILTTDDDDGATSTQAKVGATPGAVPSPGLTSPPGSGPPSASPSMSSSASPSATDTGPGSSTYVAELQEAAERAVVGHPAASLVALDTRNGEIVATVRGQTGLSGNIAPGSTFKIVSSALLMTKGVTPSSTVPCPKEATAGGRTFTNLDGFAIPNATFQQDFIRSCNTAYVQQSDRLGAGELSRFATDYFGLNSDAWTVGAPQGTTDGIVPPAADAPEKAAQMIGQGRLKMNPMTMASVVATAITGEFHQPVMRRGQPVHTAAQKLPDNVSKWMRQMMTACATSGTAASTFQGMSGVGAKTGTAEVGTASTNGWMAAYRGHIAVAVVVEGGSSGSGSAGPVVRSFLSAVSPTA